METVTVPCGGRDSITFVRDEQYNAVARVIGEQWAQYAYMRKLVYGECVVKAGAYTITWTTHP